jgi:hypothetical protein
MYFSKLWDPINWFGVLLAGVLFLLILIASFFI